MALLLPRSAITITHRSLNQSQTGGPSLINLHLLKCIHRNITHPTRHQPNRIPLSSQLQLALLPRQRILSAALLLWGIHPRKLIML